MPVPFMINGKRDYKRENLLYNSKPLQRKRRSERTLARNASNASGKTKKGDGKDLDHITPLSKGGTSNPNNLRAIFSSENRSFSRNKNSSLKSQISKRERKK